MGISIGNTSITKEVVTPVTLTTTDIISNITDAHFTSTANWSKLVYEYGVEGQRGAKEIVFKHDDNFAASSVTFSATAITGPWVCKRIVIYDFDGEYLLLTNVPSGQNITVL